MSQYPNNGYNGYNGGYNQQWQQPGYQGQQCYNGQCQPGYQQEKQGFFGNIMNRNRDRGNSSSSSSSHGSPSRRADKQRRRQMRQEQRQYNQQMGFQQQRPQGGMMGQNGGLIQDIRNKVDNVIHGNNRRFWEWLTTALFDLMSSFEYTIYSF